VTGEGVVDEASLAACVLITIESGDNCPALAVSKASNSGSRGPRVKPSSSNTVKTGDSPHAVVLSLDSAR
jgi:hypothetical protein